MRRFRRIGLSSCQRVQQAPCAVTLPSVGKVGPLKGHGVGLTPALPSSVEPIGIVPMPSGASSWAMCCSATKCWGCLHWTPDSCARRSGARCAHCRRRHARGSAEATAIEESGRCSRARTDHGGADVNPDPNVLGGAGLSPGVASSVAPSGTPRVRPARRPSSCQMARSVPFRASGCRSRRPVRTPDCSARSVARMSGDHSRSHRSLHD